MKQIFHSGHNRIVKSQGMIVIALCCLFPPVGYGQGEIEEEAIETLETIEVPATAVIQEERNISIPMPALNGLTPFPPPSSIHHDLRHPVHSIVAKQKILRDQIADRKGKRQPVRPAKAERPPYPQIAREQGWEGTVVLRLQVDRRGMVTSVTTQKSSGFPLLDESAKQSVKSWRFEPAKDGEFPIPVTVDLPIRFDLDEPS